MDPKVVEYMTECLKQKGFAVIKRSQVKTLRANATMDREVLENTEADKWEIKRLVDDIVVERLVHAIMKAPWCVRREQEALVDGTSTRFNIELTVLEDECKANTTPPPTP